MAGETVKMEIGDLRQYLTDFKSQIDYVCLTWIWEETAILESSFMGHINGCLQPLYHEFIYDRIDKDYSFIGNVEDAIEFAEKYGYWDGAKVYYEDGIVTGEIREEGSEDEDIRNLIKYGVNVYYLGLVYYCHDLSNCKTFFYNGKLERVKND